MSRVIARLPSTLKRKEECEDENDPDSDFSVFTDEITTVYPENHNLYPKKFGRLSVSRNSAKLKSIVLHDFFKKEEHAVPIRRKDARIRSNPFQQYKVPDEVVNAIFSNLRKRDLLSAMQVCKKFYAVGNESKNWMITDVMERPVTELSLITLMKRKIRILRLSGAKSDPTDSVNSRMFSSCMLSSSRLEILDLSRSNLSPRQLAILLKPCRKLKCLSLEGNILDDQVASFISDNKNLRELDISMTNGITTDGAHMIFSNCKNLEHLNAAWCGLTRPILNTILDEITDGIVKLNLSGSVRNYGLNDEHIELLSNKSKKLIDIDLSDSVELGDAAVATLISRFSKLIYISLNRCYGIDPNIIVHLNNKPSLVYLNVHGCITDSNMELFLGMCDRLKINNHLFNFTAKPSATNYYKIWGYDMREY